MIRLLQRPYNYLWGTVPILMVIAIFLNIDAAVELPFNNGTIFVSTFHMGVIFSMYLVFAGLLYWLFREVKLYSWMTILHVVLSMVLPIAVLFTCEPLTKSQVTSGLANWLVIFTFVWIIAQALFLINILLGVIRK